MTKPTTPDDIDQKNTKAKLQRAIEKYRRTTWSLDFTVEYLESLIASEVHKARVESAEHAMSDIALYAGMSGRKTVKVSDLYKIDSPLSSFVLECAEEGDRIAELSKDKEGK